MNDGEMFEIEANFVKFIERETTVEVPVVSLKEFD